MFKSTSLLDFNCRFKSNEDCYQYLMDIKWQEGFICSKCNGTEYWKGKQWQNLRCKQCGYEESATAGTLFHKIKFPLLKAFHICYRVCVSKKGMSTNELSREMELRQKTCWAFKRKIQEAMVSTEQHPLTGKVDVDECAIGGQDEQKQGRSKGDKKLIVIAVERVGKEKIGRAYGLQINDYSTNSLKTLFDKHISKDNITVRTDGWKGYEPLKAEWNIETTPSKKGKNFPEMHTIIMLLKSWLRGIHHKCSEKHMQAYLNEFFYRFNRRSFLKTLFHNLIEKMVTHAPVYHKALTT